MNHKKHSLDQLLAMDSKLAAEFSDIKKTLPELNRLIIKSADELGILARSSFEDQIEKAAEEFGELAKAMVLNDFDQIAKSIGFIYMPLVIAAQISGLNHSINYQAHYWSHDLDHLYRRISHFRKDDRFHNYRMAMTSLNGVCRSVHMDLTDCVNLAWDQIKDRKGKLIDGMFVKEADL